MQSILFLYIATEDTSSDNAFEKLKVMKEVLRSLKEVFWPTNGRDGNVLDAVRLAVFRMEQSDVFKVSHNVTRQADGTESTCNNMAASADVAKSDNVHGNDVEKNKDERVIPNLQKSAMREECGNKLNDSMGIVGIDSKGNIAIGTTSGTFLDCLPKKCELVAYLNAAIPIGDGPPIKRINLIEEVIFKGDQVKMSLLDSMRKTSKLLSEFMGDKSCTVVVRQAAKVELYSDSMQIIFALTNGKIFTCNIDGLEFREEF